MSSSSHSSGDPPSDVALVARIIEQEAAAFNLLVDRYYSFVFRICFGMLRHQQDAEDATQETFSRVAQYLDRWDPRRPFAPWLAAVAGNRCRSHLARRRSYTSLGTVSEPEANAARLDRAADLMREEIALALASLPPRQRQAFQLFHEHSMSYAQIAEALDCPLGTVKTLVHRARFSMIDQLRQRDVVHAPAAVDHTNRQRGST